VPAGNSRSIPFLIASIKTKEGEKGVPDGTFYD
jgi:hypothetical protein